MAQQLGGVDEFSQDEIVRAPLPGRAGPNGRGEIEDDNSEEVARPYGGEEYFCGGFLLSQTSQAKSIWHYSHLFPLLSEVTGKAAVLQWDT